MSTLQEQLERLVKRSADIAQSDRSGAERERLSRVVSNRLSESARKNKTTTVKRGQAPAKGAE